MIVSFRGPVLSASWHLRPACVCMRTISAGRNDPWPSPRAPTNVSGPLPQRPRGRRHSHTPAYNRFNVDFAALEHVLGYRFRDRRILAQALTHASVAKRQRIRPKVKGPVAKAPLDADPPPDIPDFKSNERLELLGDTVLCCLVTRMLFWRFPTAHEGELSRRRDSAVSNASLDYLIKELNLGRFMVRISCLRGALSPARVNANFLEALLAAIFLDGGFDAATAYFDAKIEPLLRSRVEPLTDFLGLLKAKVPAVQISISETDEPNNTPAGSPTFQATICLGKKILATATGSSKRQAQAAAARIVCNRLGIKKPYDHSVPQPTEPPLPKDNSPPAVNLSDAEEWSDAYRKEQDLHVMKSFKSWAQTLAREYPENVRNELEAFVRQKSNDSVQIGFQESMAFATGEYCFFSVCWLGSYPVTMGRGSSKKQARSVAAAQALHQLRSFHTAESDARAAPSLGNPGERQPTTQISAEQLSQIRSRQYSPIGGLIQAQLAGIPSFIVPNRYGGGDSSFSSAVEIVRTVASKGCLRTACTLAAHYATVGAAVVDRLHDTNVWDDLCWDLVLQSGLVGTERVHEQKEVALEAIEEQLASGRVMWRLNGKVHTVSGAHVVDFIWCFARRTTGEKVLVILPRSDGISVEGEGESSLECADLTVNDVLVGGNSIFKTSGLERRRQWCYGCLSAAILGALDELIESSPGAVTGGLQKRVWSIEALLSGCVAESFDGVANSEITQKLGAVLEMSQEILTDAQEIPEMAKNASRLLDWLSSFISWSS